MDKEEHAQKKEDELKPYEPPAILEEETFETMSLGCGAPVQCGGGGPTAG